MICSKCGTEVVEGAKFCTSCGNRVDNIVVCPVCETENDKNFTFCFACGSRLDGKRFCKNCNTEILENYTFCGATAVDEIIEKMLNSPAHEVNKFLSTCRLSEEEKILFARKFRSNLDVIKCLLYYHFGCTEIYKSDYNFGNEYMRLVLKYGQDNNKGS